MEILAWVITFAVSGAFFANTKADIVDKSSSGLYTLSYPTTKYGAEFFKFAFERTASQVCPEGYDIIDRTNQPNDVKAFNTKWLIECRENSTTP